MYACMHVCRPMYVCMYVVHNYIYIFSDQRLSDKVGSFYQKHDGNGLINSCKRQMLINYSLRKSFKKETSLNKNVKFKTVINV